MKKILLTATVVAMASITALAQKADDAKTKQKAEYKAACIDKVPAEAGIDAKILDEYCSCETDAIYDNFTTEEIEQIKAQSEDISEETVGKLMELIQPCAEDLMAKMQGEAPVEEAVEIDE